MDDQAVAPQAPLIAPLRHLPTGRELLLFAGILVAAAAWAFWPMPPRTLAATQEVQAPPIPPSAARQLDLAAFSASLWTVPPPPPPPPAPPPPPPALNLQLLAITSEQGVHHALVYEPLTDKVLTIKAGDAVVGRSVDSISATAVHFKLGSTAQTLTLERSGQGAGGTKP